MDEGELRHADRPRLRFGTRLWTNGLLMLIAGLLAVTALKQPPAGAVAAGSADEPRARGLVSAADQRNEIIRQLRSLNDRLGRVERQLAEGVRTRDGK